VGGRLPCGAVPQLSAWPARGGPKRCCLLCTVPYVVCTYRTLSVYERITSVPSTGFTRIYRYSTIHCMDRDPEIAIPTKAPLALLHACTPPGTPSVMNRAPRPTAPLVLARAFQTHTHTTCSFPKSSLLERRGRGSAPLYVSPRVERAVYGRRGACVARLCAHRRRL